jgi:spore coat polysaccharide biosynthesis protein SpsF (cytidylyltransferase family)
MGSSRFPGKMMAELCGKPLAEWIMRRCNAANSLDGVVLATTDLEQDDILAAVADDLGLPSYRGSLGDVLGRYAGAARAYEADIVVRICADRPLVAPEAIDLAVTTYQREKPDLAFNHIADGESHWPRGFGAEVLAAEQLYWLDENAVSQPHREHVTLYMWDRRADFKIIPVPCPGEIDPGYAGVALDVDRPADLEKLRELCHGLEPASSATTIMQRWRASRFAGSIDVS